MPKLKITGADAVIINKKQALEIRKMKWGINGNNPTAKKSDVITLPELGTFEVKDVKNILNDDSDSLANDDMNRRTDEQKELILKHKTYTDKVKTWQPLQKAERMLRTYCYLCYRAKGNDGEANDVMFEDPLYSKLIKPLIEYFEKKPNEIHAPRELYQDLMPATPTGRKEVEGWKSMANHF